MWCSLVSDFNPIFIAFYKENVSCDFRRRRNIQVTMASSININLEGLLSVERAFRCRVVKELECARELQIPIICLIDQDLYVQVRRGKLCQFYSSLHYFSQRSIIDLYVGLGFGYIFSQQVVGYRYTYLL